MRIAVIGHYIYFANHFPEHWQSDGNVLCLNVSERDYSWLVCVRNFRPDLTLFFRPELYPRRLVEAVPGIRVAFLSEPLPNVSDGRFEHTPETDLRLLVYANMAWGSYHWRIYYDEGKRESVARLGFGVDEFRPLPVDTATFYPLRGQDRPAPRYDVCFVGKPTVHRIEKLDFLRSSHLSFVWVAHGAAGADLAWVLQRSRLVLNVHADGMPAMEPRVYLGAACGGLVVSEPLSSAPSYLCDRIIQVAGPWNEEVFQSLLAVEDRLQGPLDLADEVARMGTRRLVQDVWARFCAG